MSSIHLQAVAALILFSGCYLLCRGFSERMTQAVSSRSSACFLVFGTAFLLRLIIAYSADGHTTDLTCFGAWADRMFTYGPGAFYSPDVFTDYPPGYMYVLWPIGAIRSLFQIRFGSGIHHLLLKLPSVLCDMVSGFLIYREGRKRLSRECSLILSAAYLYNPAILLNSSFWGQIDSVFTLALIFMCLALMHNHLTQAYLAFGIGVLLKPQMLLFAPVLLMGIIDHVFLQDFSRKKFLSNLFHGAGVILGMFLVCLPFGLDQVLIQYTDTLGSYPYASVNAYNIWSFFGLNWTSQENTFLTVPFKFWGIAAICLIVLFTVILSLLFKKEPSKYPLLCSFVVLSMFVCSVRMHERYLYPGLVCLLLAYLYKPARPLYLCYGAFSIMHFYNTAHVLYFYDPSSYDPRSQFVRIISLGMVCCLGYLYYAIYEVYLCPKNIEMLTVSDGSFSQKSSRNQSGILTLFRPHSASSRKYGSAKPAPSILNLGSLSQLESDPGRKLNRWDVILILAITIVYSAFALYDLGDHAAPETAWHMEQNESIELDFGDGNIPCTLSYYIAPWHNRHFILEGIGDSLTNYGELSLETVFTWKEISLNSSDLALSPDTRTLRLTLTDYNASILELVFRDAEGNILMPENASDYAALFDESYLYPERSSFRNSMYFDEIYHARTAYEFLHGLQSYENTHPPLGKFFISLGIAVFGMNPFGWRIAGTLFGIAMLPFMYLFAKKLTGNTPASALSCVLFSFDFMHFTQTRIATIDVYITFFVLLMYYFMFCYMRLNFYRTPLKKTFLPLGACGICMGMGIACKWTGVYAGAGLAILFFASLYYRYLEFKTASANPKGMTGGIQHRNIIKCFLPNIKKTICFCMVFFAAIPMMIYLLSYIPFRSGDAGQGLLSRMFENQISMYDYHSNLDASHPYSSPWYQWPAMVRPVWYYSGVLSATLREGISAFGNPLVWWAGIPAFVYMIYLIIRRKDSTAAFLAAGYLAQYLPWFFVTRITFIYHYFPCIPFIVLMIAHGLMQWKKKHSDKSFLFLAVMYGVCAFGLFLLFLPVLSGQPVETAFVSKYLRWFKSWVLTAR